LNFSFFGRKFKKSFRAFFRFEAESKGGGAHCGGKNAKNAPEVIESTSCAKELFTAE